MKYKKKRGSTLLELIIYISVGTIIITVILEMMIYSNKVFIDIKNKSIVLNEVEECFMNIDNIVKKNNVSKITINNEYMQIDILEENKYKHIRIKDKKLYVYCFQIQDKSLLSTNVLIRNIEDFRTYKKGDLIYILIKKEGKTYIRCL